MKVISSFSGDVENINYELPNIKRLLNGRHIDAELAKECLLRLQARWVTVDLYSFSFE